MKKILLIVILTLSLMQGVVNATPDNFIDIKNHWAEKSIIAMTQKGIVSGYLDNTFKPENEITMMEFLKIVIEIADYNLIRKGNSVYPDFYYETAIENNLIERDCDVNLSMSRYDMVEILDRFINMQNVREGKNIFKDLHTENASKVLKLVKLNVINGYNDKSFRGENKVTRAEAVTVIIRASEAREKIISSSNYDVTTNGRLSNYLKNDKITSVKTFYEIKDNKILIYDRGRFANLNGYIIKNEIITTNAINIIKSLVNPKAYVAVIYVPSQYTINELKICYGKDEMKALCGEYDFSFTYYENDTYKLASKSLNEIFSDKCYLRIDLVDIYENDTVDELKKSKLLEALNIEFGSNAKRVLNYMLNECRDYERNSRRAESRAKKRVFGEYIVNYYQKENGIPQFYIERK